MKTSNHKAAMAAMLSRLAPGYCAVDATFAGKTLHENVVVKAGQPATAAFLWAAGTGESHS